MEVLRKDVRVPAAGHTQGVCVFLRRPGRTRRVRVLTASRFDPSVAGLARFQEMLFRASIVGAEGLVHPETGEPLAFTMVEHPELGPIASSDVYDALPDELLRPIGDVLGVGGETGITEGQIKN